MKNTVMTSREIISCSYCHHSIVDDDFLFCLGCEKNVHIKCLKRPGTPGDLLGDVFFQFKCINCGENGKETFIREKLPWVLLIALTIYNLSIQANGLSHHGYFHWRTHIAYFIDKNWAYLFQPLVKRKKKWIGTISGTLSHYSPDFFSSGSGLVNESGWWKLTHNETPKFYLDFYETLPHNRQTKFIKQEVRNTESDNASDIGEGSSYAIKVQEEVFSRTIPYMGRPPRHLKNPENDLWTTDAFDNNLLDDLSNINSCADLLPPIATDVSCIFGVDQNFDALDWNTNELEDVVDRTIIDRVDESSFQNDYQPRIIRVTNFQESDETDVLPLIPVEKIKQENDSETEDEYEQLECPPSLFNVTVKRKAPWEEEEKEKENDTTAEENDDSDEKIESMTLFEENELLFKMKAALQNPVIEANAPRWIRQFYRKLELRKTKRQLGLPNFDLDNIAQNGCRGQQQACILDRYQQIITTSTSRQTNDASFFARLTGNIEYDLFESPYTSRVLHPLIFRNSKCIPPWVKLMCEVQFRVNNVPPSRASIDYCYLRPHHIPAVNSLLQKMFWPGIDLSDCLSYPDFSIVAMYKKLVVGCAFLVPDVGHNEAYVSFMAVRPAWQRAGIASFMLYHLTQTCMGKDITLHVSATNPAICLYQKFGFKIEELILEFYDKYLPSDSTYSRHAFHLRMQR